MDKITTKFQKVGTEAFAATPAPVLRGKLASKGGNAKGGATPDAGTATHRDATTQDRLGASYRITASKQYMATDARVQANGRVMPSAVGTNNLFRLGRATQ